jgi:hypothetical protein
MPKRKHKAGLGAAASQREVMKMRLDERFEAEFIEDEPDPSKLKDDEWRDCSTCGARIFGSYNMNLHHEFHTGLEAKP